MSIVSQERLSHELERLRKQIERKKLSDKEAAIQSAKARIAKAESHLDFVKGQTEARLQQAIEQNQAKQLLLASQIEQLRKWERFYVDMLTNHATILTDAKTSVKDAERRLGELTGTVPTAENVNEEFERIMAMAGSK